MVKGMTVYVDPSVMRQRRVEAFMTQAALAEKANVGLSTIERLERGEDPVGVRYLSLQSVAHALGVKIDDLIEHVEA